MSSKSILSHEAEIRSLLLDLGLIEWHRDDPWQMSDEDSDLYDTILSQQSLIATRMGGDFSREDFIEAAHRICD